MDQDPHSWLSRAGLLNFEGPTLPELTDGKSRDLKATYCSSHCARRGVPSARGQLIFVGDHYLRRCPYCGGDILFFDTVTPRQAATYWARKSAERKKDE